MNSFEEELLTLHAASPGRACRITDIAIKEICNDKQKIPRYYYTYFRELCPYVIAFEYRDVPESFDNLSTWIEENCNGWWYYDMYIGYTHYIYAFEDKKSAAFFKLRWI